MTDRDQKILSPTPVEATMMSGGLVKLQLARDKKVAISDRDQKILDSIAEFWSDEGEAPTLLDIATGAGLTPAKNYKSVVFYACRRLVDLKKLDEITVPFGSRRSYRLAEDDGQQPED